MLEILKLMADTGICIGLWYYLLAMPRRLKREQILTREDYQNVLKEYNLHLEEWKKWTSNLKS